MDKYFKVFSIFLFLFAINFANGQPFKFSSKIIDFETHQPLMGTGIYFLELNKYGFADKNGYISIDSIPFGRHIIRVRLIGYDPIIDTVFFDKNIQKDYLLKYPIVNYNVIQLPEYIEYHKKLSASQSERPVLEINIDSLESRDGYLWFYSTFYNNSNYPIYVLHEKECIRPFEFQITNSSNEIFKTNCISLSCDTRLFYNPDSNDLIKIKPKSYYKYPRASVWLYNFIGVPKDEYKISIVYEYKNPLAIRVERDKNINNYLSEFYAARIGLRGKFKSKNSIIFKN